MHLSPEQPTSLPSPIEQHQAEMALAAVAGMEQRFADAIEICNALLDSPIYDQMSKPERQQYRAEACLMLGSALHCNRASYRDTLRALEQALDGPVHVQKDAYFALALVHQAHDQIMEAEKAMLRCMSAIDAARELVHIGADSGEFEKQYQDAQQFLGSLRRA